jgi:hypothetical protein
MKFTESRSKRNKKEVEPHIEARPNSGRESNEEESLQPAPTGSGRREETIHNFSTSTGRRERNRFFYY